MKIKCIKFEYILWTGLSKLFYSYFFANKTGDTIKWYLRLFWDVAWTHKQASAKNSSR